MVVRAWHVVALPMLWLAMSGTASAQPKTDVVTLVNGNAITGEVSSLGRGRLEDKTDDVGTIYIEWDKIASVVATGQFEVTTTDGQRFLGSLAAGNPRSLVVVSLAGTVSLSTADVTTILPIGLSFWKRLDGSVDVGFSYTRSSHVAQLNVNTTTIFRRPAFEGRLTGLGTLTQNEDGSRDDRGTVQASYIRFHGQRLFVGAGASFESNESLGLLLRSQGAVTVGPRLVNTNRAQVAVGGGLAVNDERSVDAEPTQNLEGIFTFKQSVLPGPLPSHEPRHILPVRPEPDQLGPPASPIRCERQARNLERRVRVGEHLRHVRQPAGQRERRAQRRRVSSCHSDGATESSAYRLTSRHW